MNTENRSYKKWSQSEKEYLIKQMQKGILDHAALCVQFNCTRSQLQKQIKYTKLVGLGKRVELKDELMQNANNVERVFEKVKKRKRYSTKRFSFVPKDKDYSDLLLSSKKHTLEEAIRISVKSIQKLRKEKK